MLERDRLHALHALARPLPEHAGGEPFDELRRDDLEEEQKKEVARRFLVRRLTEMRIGGRVYTKNQYRREWRRGGVAEHDEPIRVTDPRQRLVVALVQKKVAELLGSERFNRSFQIGMLASFESFLETARLKRSDEDAETTFDDAEQADTEAERDGLDVRDLNRLAQDYRQKFGTELPHPKMDAVVERLMSAWTTGRKALVFVRRVASVTELKRKLDERYDKWLIPHVLGRLPAELRADFDRAVGRYRVEKEEAAAHRRDRDARVTKDDEDTDRGGTDTFFAWYFRGDESKGVVSGASIQQRFTQKSGALATFFSENYAAALLGVSPTETLAALALAVGASEEETRRLLRAHATPYISRAKRVTSGMRFDAAQAAALELLRDRAQAPLGADAGAWAHHFAAVRTGAPVRFATGLDEVIARHSWPGNLTQLDGAIARALALRASDDAPLTASDLGIESVEDTIEPLSEAVERFRREYILRVLARFGGNRSRTARALGVDARTVFRYLEREDDG